VGAFLSNVTITVIVKFKYQRLWSLWLRLHRAAPSALRFYFAFKMRNSWETWMEWHKHDLTTAVGQAHQRYIWQCRRRRMAVLIAVVMRQQDTLEEIAQNREMMKRLSKQQNFNEATRYYLGMFEREFIYRNVEGQKGNKAESMRRKVHRRVCYYMFQTWILFAARSLETKAQAQKQKAIFHERRAWELNWEARTTCADTTKRLHWRLAGQGAEVISHAENLRATTPHTQGARLKTGDLRMKGGSCRRGSGGPLPPLTAKCNAHPRSHSQSSKQYEDPFEKDVETKVNRGFKNLEAVWSLKPHRKWLSPDSLEVERKPRSHQLRRVAMWES